MGMKDENESDNEEFKKDEYEDEENERDYIKLEFNGYDEAYEFIYLRTDIYIMLNIICRMQVDLVSWTFKLNIFLSFLTWGRGIVENLTSAHGEVPLADKCWHGGRH